MQKGGERWEVFLRLRCFFSLDCGLLFWISRGTSEAWMSKCLSMTEMHLDRLQKGIVGYLIRLCRLGLFIVMCHARSLLFPVHLESMC